MKFPLYFYLTLLVISPWPIFFSLMLYYGYKFDTTFEYYITKKKQLYKFWLILLVLPIIFSYIFLLRYNRIGISLDVLKVINFLLEVIAPLKDIDLIILGVFIFLFVIPWLLAIRIVYQYFRKCLLALYLYYHQYSNINNFYRKLFFFSVDYNLYLIRRVSIFTSNKKLLTLTNYICPIFTDSLERNFFTCIIPYLIIFDFIIQDGQISKIFILLPWYYVYSLIRFALKFFYGIHKPANWKLAKEMYGHPK